MSSADLNDRLSFLDLTFLVFASFFLFLVGLGSGSLASWDEALYAQVAKEAYVSGQWLHLTTNNGVLWMDKPFLAIWPTTLFYHLFGISEFTSRLFSALCAATTVLVTYGIAAKLFDRWTGYLSALVLLSAKFYLRHGRFAMLDAPVTFFMTLAIYFFVLGQERNKFFILSGIAIGLGFLIKSFTALMVLPILGIYSIGARHLSVFKERNYWTGIFLMAALILAWALYEYAHYGKAFIDEALLRHLVSRTTQAMEGHSGGWDYYIRTLITKYKPWIFVAAVSVPVFVYKSFREKRDGFILVSLWVLVVLLMTSIVKTKLRWYIYPIYPALSISVGYCLAQCISRRYKLWVKVGFVLVVISHIYLGHIFFQDYGRVFKGMAPAIKKEVAAERPIYLYNMHDQPAALFYTDRVPDYMDSRESFLATTQENINFFVLMREPDFLSLQADIRNSGMETRAVYEDARLIGPSAR